ISNVALISSATLNEGSTAAITGSMQNFGSNDTLTLVVDWGDNLNGSPTLLTFPGTQTSFTITHTYLDNVPAGLVSNFNVNLTLGTTTPLTGTTSTSVGPVTVLNVAPTVSLPGVVSSSINENGIATLTATLTDPGVLDTFTVV